MNSGNIMHSTPNQSRAPYKFLRRNLDFDDFKKTTLQKICIKKLHLKNLSNNNLTPKEECSLFFKNKKIFKTLHSIFISSVSQSSIYTSLKTSKTIILNPMIDGLETDMLTQFLKKLPPRITALIFQIQVGDIFLEKDLATIARSIRYFPQLKSFSRSHSFSMEPLEDYVLEELRAYHGSVSRIKGLEHVAYRIDRSDQASFQKAMRSNDDVYPAITSLDIELEVQEFETFPQIRDRCREEKFHDPLIFSFDFKNLTDEEKSSYLIVQDEIRKADKNAIGNFDLGNNERLRILERNFLANCIMCEEMKPFFRFDRFPNLKKLHLSNYGSSYPVGSFVINGFAALKNLQDLTINFEARPQGSSYIFKGLLKLPLLKKFHFEISWIKNEEWMILLQFLKKQNDLRSLFLQVFHKPKSKAHYLQQHFFLEAFIWELENKKSLRSLTLQLDFCSLESISQSFATLSMKDQLETFSFRGIEDPIFSQKKSGKKLEGLCTFIKNQKGSLKKLDIYLPYIFGQSILRIAQAISELINLKELLLGLGEQEDFLDQYVEYFQEVVICELRPYPRASNLDIAKYIQRLQNLETLIFNVSIDPDSGHWLEKFVEILGDFKKLREIRLSAFSYNKVYLFQPKFISVFENWDQIRVIRFEFDDFNRYRPNLFATKEIKRILQKQAMRSDIMF